MWKIRVDLKEYNNHTLMNVFKFKLKQVRYYLNKNHKQTVKNWLLNDDFSILKLILYKDLFFWLLNCFLSNDDEYKFIVCLIRTFNADVSDKTADWKVNAVLKLKDKL